MDAVPGKIIGLNDGSTWMISEFGAPEGRPFFYFHGFPGSRLEAALAERCAAGQHIRLIAMDRPGYGGTPFRARDTIADWHHDVARLADYFGLERFGVLGVSGGGPYALATACYLESRIGATGIVCGLGSTKSAANIKGMPFLQRFGLVLANRSPVLVMPLFYFLMTLLRLKPGLFLSHLVRSTGPADQRALKDQTLREVLKRSIREALLAGPRGAWWDLKLYTRPWGFDPAQIRSPVWLWYGTADHIIPAAMGRALATALPDCRPVFISGEGHFSLIHNHMPLIVKQLASAYDRTTG